jgi:hypothetical protein
LRWLVDGSEMPARTGALDRQRRDFLIYRLPIAIQ